MATEQDMIARIQEILKQVFITDKNVEIWLNEPHPDLGQRTPQQCIDNGNVGAVLTMLENALIGTPT